MTPALPLLHRRGLSPEARRRARAIGASTAERVAISLLRDGRVRRAYLGIGGVTLALPTRVVRHFNLARNAGVRIEPLAADSPASAAGLSVGDVVIALDGAPIGGNLMYFQNL